MPSFQGEDCSFCGVFDGTVGDDASEFINQNVIRYLCSNLGMDKAGAENVFIATASTSVDTVGESTDPTDKPCPTPSSGGIPDKVAEKLREGIRNTFLDADGALIEMCTERRLHYASSTGVTGTWMIFRRLLLYTVDICVTIE